MATPTNRRRSSQNSTSGPSSPISSTPRISAEEQSRVREHPPGITSQSPTPISSVQNLHPRSPRNPVISAPSYSLHRRRPKTNTAPVSAAFPIDFHTLDYVTPCDENLMCAICHSPFVNPIRLRCDHLFCRECLSTALENQPKEAQSCPSCRAVMEDDLSLPMPRVVLRMLEELKVKCPNQTIGCQDVVARGFVEHHVEKYCEFEKLDCPLEGCSLKTRRRDVNRGCLHTTVNCHDCSEAMMEKDIERHQLEQCRGIISCPHCNSNSMRCDLPDHVENCPEALLPCSASAYGCTHLSKRTGLDQHLTSCPLAKLGPFLQAQKERLDEHEAALKIYQHRNEILESAMSSIQATLGTGAAMGSTLLDTSLAASPISLLSLSQPTATATSAASDNPPFDSATHHLLSLHESLREEVDRVSTALSELDAKTSMMLMNESLRAKEDMAHTNAAVNAIRMQLHWLISARLQTQTRGSNGAPVGGSSGSPRGGLGGATGSPALPVRRMSDAMRQETKL